MHVLEQDLDLCHVTETWLSFDDPEVAPSGYNIISTPRIGKKGGGIGTIYRSNLDVELCKQDYNLTTLEYQELKLSISGKHTYIMLLYRPPDGSITDFIHDLVTYLESNIQRPDNTIFVGDFNINMLNNRDSDVVNFTQFLECFNLVNVVKFPTHSSGSCIDLCLTDYEDLVIDVSQGPLISDHHAVRFNMLSKKND